MAQALLLGLDVGTTAVKAAVIDGDGREVAHGRAPTPWREVPTGAELHPRDLLRAAARAGAEALDDAPSDGELAGLGVAGMAETGVLLDAHGEPVVPSIAWYDTRGEEQALLLERDLPDFAARAGLPATTLATLVKYAWLRAHRPDAARGVRWLNVAEWVVRGLGGDEAAELSLASRTGFYDLHERAPWAESLAWAGAPDGLAPEAVPAGTPMGRADGELLPAAAGAVLTVGGHDHLAAAVGAGAAGEGDVLDSNGTAEAFVRTVAPFSPEGAARAVGLGFTVGWHAVEDRQAVLGAVWAGSALSAVLALLGVPVEERHALEEAALGVRAAPLRLVGAGDDEMTVRGIDRTASPARVYRAALEAVAEQGEDVLRRMEALTGSPARRLVVTGGWATGAAARAVKEAHLGAFEHSPAISTGARGAALAAGRAAGLWTIDDMPHPPRAAQEASEAMTSPSYEPAAWPAPSPGEAA